MQWYQCSLFLTKTIDTDKIYSFETFCPVPFGFLTSGDRDSVSPCCKYSHTIGSLKTHSLNEIFFGEQMSQLRQDIKNGQYHKGCKSCWDAEKVNATSLRKHYVTKLSKLCDQEWIDRPGIRDLTVSPSILCNFKCRICSEYKSSKIATETLKFSTDPAQQQQLKKIINFSTHNQSQIADQIFQAVSDLEFLHILGGEPFLWQDLETLVDKLISTGHSKNIQIEFNTNGSIFPDHIIEKLLKFKLVEILISIDDIEDRFELQRGDLWANVYKNICAFRNIKTDQVSVKIMSTVNIQNVLYLDHLVDFCDRLGLEIVWNYLETPNFLSIDSVTNTVKNLVYSKYKDHPMLELQSIANRMKHTPAVGGNLFLEYMTDLDQKRGQDSQKVLKEIFEAMQH